MITGQIFYGKETLRRFLEEKPRPPRLVHRLPVLLTWGVVGGLFVTALAVAVYGEIWK